MVATKKDRQALVILLELTQELTNPRPQLEDSLQAVTQAALKLLPGDHASIRLLDGSHSELLSGARSGSGRDQAPMTFRRGEGIIGWVVDHSEGVLVADVAKDRRFIEKIGAGFSIRSLIAEPLWSAGHVIGVLSTSSPKASVFSKDHQILARLLANCSSPPIERARLGRLAMTDDLTLAYNQRYLQPRVYEEIDRARRSGMPVSVLLMDLDHFKKVNDDYGHAVGDMALRLFADRVRTMVRRMDIFVRRGGEEFTLVMPSTTLEHAMATAERIRGHLADSPLSVGEGILLKQTVSIGLATWDRSETPEELQQRADVAMYRAKELGRNRVAVADESDGPMPISMRAKPA